MPELRPNRAKHLLQEGRPVIGVSESYPDTIDQLGSLGVVDLIWIEMEHGQVTCGTLSGHWKAALPDCHSGLCCQWAALLSEKVATKILV